MEAGVQAQKGRGFALVEMAEDGLADIGAKFLPSVGFGDNGVAECAGNETAIGVVLGNLKYDFTHGFSVADGDVVGKKVYHLRR
jgi:hypothetical protein